MPLDTAGIGSIIDHNAVESRAQKAHPAPRSIKAAPQ